MEEKFIEICRMGDLDRAKKFLRLNPDIKISARDDCAFHVVCEYGHLKIAMWLLQVKPDIKISACDDYAFRWACDNGHLEVAKWLLQVKPDIDISAKNEFAFRWACINGHLEVAKWLLHVKPDINISAQNDFAFNMVFNRHLYGYYTQLKIAQWLQTLRPYLYVIEYDKNGNYAGFRIRRKEEANWEKRKCALHLAYQEETNILYHLPVDIAKAVTLFV